MRELPRGWRNELLTNLADLRGGVTKGRDLKDLETIELPYLRVANVQDGFLSLGTMKTIRVLPEDLAKYRLERGDVLYTEGGDRDKLGRGAVWRDEIRDCIHQNHVFRARPRNDLVDSYYLAYFSQSQSAKSYFFKHGKQTTNLASINMTILASLPIRLPPLSEQVRIVAKLDELFSDLDAGVASLNQARAQVKVYRQAVLKRAFEGRLVGGKGEEIHRGGAENAEGREGLPEGWRWERLGTLVEKPRYGTSKRSEYGQAGTGVLRIPNIGNGIIEADDLKYAMLDSEELRELNLNPGDILTIRSNGSVDLVGKCALIREMDTGFVFAGYLIRLRPIPSLITPSFLLYSMSSPNLRLQITRKAKSTSGVNNVNTEELRGLELPLPPLAEQHAIVAEIERRFSVADALDATIDQSLKQAEALRQSLLQKAFRGELVSQEAVDG